MDEIRASQPIKERVGMELGPRKATSRDLNVAKTFSSSFLCLSVMVSFLVIEVLLPPHD